MEVKLREQLEQSPDNEETILQLAVVLTKQSREMEATHLLNNALVQNPYSTKIAMGLGQLYLQVERIDYALQVFESLQCAHPCLADLNYWLGSAQLRSGRPLTAFRTLLYGQHSTEKMVHAQQLLRGAALASLGLQCEANQEFMGVYHCTEDAELRSSALELQNQMDDALNSLPRLRGSLKYGVRFDDNPGVVPSFNQLGISPLMPTPSWGNSVVGQLTYDLYRDDNRDLVTGYTMFHTTNFTNHTFDLLDNAVFLSASERGLINETPYISSLSGPFRNYCIGYALR